MFLLYAVLSDKALTNKRKKKPFFLHISGLKTKQRCEFVEG
jgi:hypothetical protein